MLLIRCDRCHTVVWIRREGSASIVCSHCDQLYELPPRIRERTMDDVHRQARGLARELGVDFPSATSMVFGILKLPQIRDFLRGDDDPEPEEAETELENPGWSGAFDEAFRPAIEAGRLTHHAALQRGNRDRYASKIVERHGIRLEDAYRVADNEEPLLSVLRRRKAARPRTLVKRRRIPKSVFVVAVLVVVVGLSVWRIDRGLKKEAALAVAAEAERAEAERSEREMLKALEQPQPPTTAPAPDLFFDQLGRVTRISSPRPESVLEAYCRSPELRPLALAEGMMPDKNLWFGVFSDVADPQRMQAIVIRKESKGGQWVAGDGLGLIKVLNPRPERLGKRRELDPMSGAINAAGSR